MFDDEFTPAGMKLLLVDDMPTNIDVLRNTLEREHYDVAVATDGEQALKTAAYLIPDLILLDVMMPGIDGFETCRRLKQQKNLQDIPVIFCTARSEPEDIAQGFASGGVDYITKPYRQEEVRIRVRTHLQLHYLTQRWAERAKHLEELNALKDKFIGIAAHDLRSPLTSISILAETLLKMPDTPPGQQQHCLHTIANTSRGMAALINNILDYSSIESGGLHLDMELSQLQTLIKERIELFTLQAQQKEIKIENKLEEIPMFFFDRHGLTQIIDNLITNAIKFSPGGTSIFVALNLSRDHVRFTVRDQGPGFQEADKDKLFTPFQRLSARPTKGEKSSGLGLAIIKKTIDAHEGSIHVSNHVQGGAEFTVELPFRTSA